MTIIDHRVLVNAPPEVVWELLGDLAALPKWHINCQDTRILTTQSQGVGVRRRNTMSSGPDTVEEILTWYNNLGFEYTVVDGPRYHSNRGRLRLQAIPEGTVVQWTFEYQLGGALAFLRDFFLRRRLNDEAARSLKRFKQLVESAGIRMDAATVERVSLRPAPDVNARAALGEATTRARNVKVELPQTPPAASEKTQVRLPPTPPPDRTAPQTRPAVLDIGADDLPPLEGIAVEPPRAEEDTRPRPPVETPAPTSTPLPEPDLPPLAEETALQDTVRREPADLAPLPDLDTNDTVPVAPPVEDFSPLLERRPVELAEPPYTAPIEPPVEAEPEQAIEEHESQPVPLPEPSAETGRTEPVRPEAAASWAEPVQQVPVIEEPESPTSQDEYPAPRPEPDAIGPSIWEVFGIAPPSSQGQAPTPSGVEPEPAPVAPSIEHAPTRTRLGFYRRTRPARHGNIIRVRRILKANGLRARLALRQANRLSRH